MIYTSITFFSLAAIIGMILLSFLLKDKQVPKPILFVHGTLAVIGLILLIIFTVNNTGGPVESIVLFVIAAIGGITLAIRDFSGKPGPKWLAITHGLIAASGLIFLLIYTFGKV